MKSNHILCSIYFFLKSCHLWDNVEKYCTARRATMRRKKICCFRTEYRKQEYRHTLRIFNTYWLPMVTVVTRTLLSITSYVHFLSCLGMYWSEALRPWRWKQQVSLKRCFVITKKKKKYFSPHKTISISHWTRLYWVLWVVLYEFKTWLFHPVADIGYAHPKTNPWRKSLDIRMKI
jgi:hypothetical protein